MSAVDVERPDLRGSHALQVRSPRDLRMTRIPCDLDRISTDLERLGRRRALQMLGTAAVIAVYHLKLNPTLTLTPPHLTLTLTLTLDAGTAAAIGPGDGLFILQAAGTTCSLTRRGPSTLVLSSDRYWK